MTFLTQKLEKEIKNDRIKNGKILKKIIEPVIYDWGRRYLVARDPESAFFYFKNQTLPMFKECIKNLFIIIPSSEKENAEYLKTLDERINEANKISDFDKTVTVRYQFEVGNELVNLSFKKLLKEHLDLIREPYSLEKEIGFIKKDVEFAVNRYVKSYMKSEKSRFGPKGVYDTSPLGQAELKFAFDEILKLKVSRNPILPRLKPENYYEIGIEDKMLIYDISRIMEKMSDKYGNLRYFISKYGTSPLCYPNMCVDFLLGKDYEVVGIYLKMIGHLEFPEFKPKPTRSLDYID